jgi:hypothetical protein
MTELEKKFKRTPNGLEITGLAQAMLDNIKKYPNYFDRAKEHSEYFKINELIEELKKEGKL